MDVSAVVKLKSARLLSTIRVVTRRNSSEVKKRAFRYGYATPMRCDSLDSGESLQGIRHLSLWLCHSDARQVYDLPTARPPFHRVCDPAAVIDRPDLERLFRQVEDLPRTRKPKPCSLAC